RVKLTDFGVARLRDLGLTRVSAIIGTPAFMAPEQFRGGDLDHRADLFSCGVLLFLLLSGRRPFSGAPAAVMHQILHEQAPLLSEASGGLVGRAFDEVMSRALAKPVEQRFASADEMRDALRAAAALAADSPLATVVETLVQHAGRTHVGRALGGLQEPRGSGGERAPTRPVQPVAPMVVHEGPGRPLLLDASTLYSHGADRRAATPDNPSDADADGTLAASVPASPLPLSAEFCARAQQVLSGPLGPLAGMLVKRAASMASGSRAAFIAQLLAQLPAPCPATLQAQLEALLSPSQRTETGR
ncbi:MAG: serine/threonine-protein kinase, partial [Vitreoscilla sp.]